MNDSDDLGAGGAGCLIGVLCLLGALGILGFQAVLWLKDGVWTPLPLSTIFVFLSFDIPAVEWKGLQEIVNWVLGTPISASLIVFGIVIGWIGFWIEETIQSWQQTSRNRLAKKMRRKLGYTDEED